MSVIDFESRQQLEQELFPNGTPTQRLAESITRQNAEDWIVARLRHIRAALRSQDEELIKEIVNDYACIFGIPKAMDAYFKILLRMSYASDGLNELDELVGDAPREEEEPDMDTLTTEALFWQMFMRPIPTDLE